MLPQQRQIIFDRVGYTPSPEQQVMHDSMARMRLVAGGERSGKSRSAAMELIGRFLEGKLYWLVAADYERTRAEFNYICEALAKLSIPFEATKQVNPGEINIAGGFRIATKSSQDPRRIAMEAPDGVLVCEASQIDYETFLRLRGRIAEKKGWLLLSGTFETSLGWYAEAYQRGLSYPNIDDLQSFSIPTWSNKAIFPGGRADPEIIALERASSPEWFLERYGGTPCPPKGLVFTEFRTALHTGSKGLFDFEPAYDVQLWVDPGTDHYYAVEVAQRKGDHVYIVDEVYEKGMVTSDIITIVKQRPWFPKVIGGAIDIAAIRRQSMPAVAEIWVKEAKVPLRSQYIRIQDGIERMKAVLKVNPVTGQPQFHINSKCKGLISELGGCPNPSDGQTRVYRWKLDREGNVVGEVPDDKNNDACKAVAYGLVDMLGYTITQRKPTIRFF